jgi:hypothetical protein
MLSLVLAAIGLVLFFSFTLHYCIRDGQDAETRWDSNIDLMRKSPFGRWRY